MNYYQNLTDLRRAILLSPVEEPPKKSSTGFVQMRQKEDTTDSRELASRPNEWLKQIKQASEEIKNTAPKGGFVSGLAKTVSNAIDRKVEAKKSPSKDTADSLPLEEKLIRRRSDLPSTYAPRASNVATFKEAVDATEGGGRYDTLFGHSQKEGGQFSGVDVSNMTIKEISEFAKPSGAYGQWVKTKVGRVATPMGRYQFVGTTLKAVAKDMGLSEDTIFSPDVQDQMFDHYLGQIIRSGKSLSDKVSRVRSGWEGFKSIPTKTLEKLILEYENQ